MKRNRVSQIEVDQFAEAIVRYLESHPDAADSEDGIASWWLQDDTWKSKEIVARAIERLSREGVLERVSLPSGKIVYSGNK